MAQITIVNNTSENIRVAIFKKPYKQPTLSTIAWEVVTAPQSGNTNIQLPSNYSVYVSYSNDPASRDDPNGGNKTVRLSIDEPTAKFIVVEKKENDQTSSIVALEKVFQDLVENEVHIVNQASFGVWGHAMLNDQDVYPPQIITPGRTLMEDVTSPHHIAVVDEFVNRGNVVKVEELSSLPIEILDGDTVTVTGNKWDGYSLNK